jgi:hypothetical protein
MSCKYCCDLKSQKDLFNENNKFVYINSDYKKLNVEIETLEGSIIYFGFNIIHCPMCGREL